MLNKLKILLNLFRNIGKMLALAWETDAWLTGGYYLTSAIGGMMPVLEGIAVKTMINTLGNVQSLGTKDVAIGVVFLAVVWRYLIPFTEYIIYWGMNNSYIDYLFRYKLQNRVTLRFYEKLVNLDIQYFEDPKSQDLITKTRDTMQWRVPDMMRMFGYLFKNTVLITSTIIVLLQFGWWVPVVVVLVGLPRLIAQMTLGKTQWSIYGSGAPQARKLWYFSWILGEQTAVKEIRIMQSAPYLLSRFREIQEKLYNLNKKPLDNILKVILTFPLVELGILLLIAWTFFQKLVIGQMTVGDFILLSSTLLLMRGNLVGLAVNLGETYAANLHTNDFFKVLSLPEKLPEPTKPKKIITSQPPRVEFRNVTFSYPGGKKVLNKVNLVIEPGENVALVGINGAGKSTMIKLLCRFYDVTDGEILINGVNIKEIKKSDLYSLMGTLFQEFMQYHFSVKENIMMGSVKNQKIDRMKLAAKQAGADKFIEKLPQKYEQILGREYDDGEQLSGGQWQKLAIARAFYEQAPLLILDEPTSAIDAEAEFEIFNNLQKVYRDKTLVLVSHRFSTVRNADKIYVIEAGKVIESGSHKELLAENGKYARMFKVQAKGYES